MLPEKKVIASASRSSGVRWRSRWRRSASSVWIFFSTMSASRGLSRPAGAGPERGSGMVGSAGARRAALRRTFGGSGDNLDPRQLCNHAGLVAAAEEEPDALLAPGPHVEGPVVHVHADEFVCHLRADAAAELEGILQRLAPVLQAEADAVPEHGGNVAHRLGAEGLADDA